MHCTLGDIIVACVRKTDSFLKLELAMSPGKDPVWFPVVTSRTTYALAPKEEGGSERYDAIRSWERQFHSVTEFLEVKERQGMPMPAVSACLVYACRYVYHTDMYCIYNMVCFVLPSIAHA